jgi:hypothetical protein
MNRIGGGKKKLDNTGTLSWPTPVVPSASPYRPRIFDQEVGLSPRTAAKQDSKVHYPAALVIGLGAAGRMALQSVMDQIEIDLLADVAQLRFIQFDYGEHAVPLKARKCTFDQINLKPGQGVAQVVSPIGRGVAVNAFMHAPKYLDISTCFRDQLSLLHDLRVYFVFSLREAASGLLANVLQLIKRNHPDKIAMVTAFVTLDIPQGVTPIRDGELHAALLELGRFSMRETHVMHAPVGQQDGAIVQQTLIDHLFFTDAEFPKNPELRKKPYDESSGQLLAEALYLFLHPSSGEIHERRRNILTASTEIVKQLNTPIVNSFSLATLRIPVAELQEYVRTRLGRAVIFGDPPQAQPGWIQNLSNSTSAQQQAKSWLFAQPGHPFFEWLLEVKDASKLKPLPQIGSVDRDNFSALYQWQLLSGVNKFLEQEGNLRVAWEALEILKRHCEMVSQLGKQAEFKDTALPRWGVIRQLLTSFTSTSQAIQNALEEWLKVMYGKQEVETWTQKESAAPTPGDLFRVFEMQAQDSSQEDAPVKSMLDADEQAALLGLRRASGGNFCMPVLEVQADSPGLDELYKQIVPPGPDSSSYKDLRRRLGWWVHMDAGTRQIVLKAVFLPNGSREGQPVQFYARQAKDLIKEVQNFAANQAQTVHAEMAEEWFNRQTWSKRQFLMRAASLPFLAYNDAELDAALQQQKAGSRLGYVIGQTVPQGDAYLEFLFTNLAQEQKRSLPNGEKTRLSALGINSFIPLKTLKIFKDTDAAYRREANVHLFPQERHARQLESEIRNDWMDNGETERARQFDLIIPIVATLWHRGVERLFFRALACGMIGVFEVRQHAFGEEPRRWRVKEFSNYPSFDLASANLPIGLWEAYRQFTLVLPISPHLAPKEINNPLNPFRLDRRAGFYNLFLEQCDVVMRQVDAKAIIAGLREEMTRIRRLTDQPVVANNFCDLMEYELLHLNEPIERFTEPMFR